MLTTVRHIFGRIMHSETALHSQWDKGRKNNLLFASPSIRRPTCIKRLAAYIRDFTVDLLFRFFWQKTSNSSRRLSVSLSHMIRLRGRAEGIAPFS